MTSTKQKSLRSNPIFCNKGYTLLETMVALALFLAVIVPLTERMVLSIRVNRGKDKIIATSLVEQEAARLKAFPDQIFSSKQRVVKGRKWTIKASFTGKSLKQCQLEVYKGRRFINRTIFYVHALSK